MTSDDLAARMLANDSSLAVIDVRDSDYIGGHIKGCHNVPTNTLDYKIPELIRTLQDKDTVIFHCALSQQRGPSAALRYLREQRRKAQDGESKQQVYVLDRGFVGWQEKRVSLFMLSTLTDELGLGMARTKDSQKAMSKRSGRMDTDVAATWLLSTLLYISRLLS